MAVFKLPNDTNFKEVTQTSYYQWLSNKKPSDIHAVKTKTEYIESLGFVLGQDRLEEGVVRHLKFIEDVFFKREIRGIQ